jgi:hypothetical protein
MSTSPDYKKDEIYSAERIFNNGSSFAEIDWTGYLLLRSSRPEITQSQRGMSSLISLVERIMKYSRDKIMGKGEQKIMVFDNLQPLVEEHITNGIRKGYRTILSGETNWLPHEGRTYLLRSLQRDDAIKLLDELTKRK